LPGIRAVKVLFSFCAAVSKTPGPQKPPGARAVSAASKNAAAVRFRRRRQRRRERGCEARRPLGPLAADGGGSDAATPPRAAV